MTGIPALTQSISGPVEDTAGRIIGMIADGYLYIIVTAVHPANLENEFKLQLPHFRQVPKRGDKRRYIYRHRCRLPS